MDNPDQHALKAIVHQRDVERFWSAWASLSARDSARFQHTFLEDQQDRMAWVEANFRLAERKRQRETALDSEDPGTVYEWAQQQRPTRAEAFEALETYLEGHRIQEAIVKVLLPRLHADDLTELFPALINYTEDYTLDPEVEGSLELLMDLLPAEQRAGALSDVLDKVAADGNRTWAERLEEKYGETLISVNANFYDSSLIHAVINNQPAMMGWLIQRGADLEVGLRDPIKEDRLEEVDLDDALLHLNLTTIEKALATLHRLGLPAADLCPRTQGRVISAKRQTSAEHLTPDGAASPRQRYRP